MQAATCLTGAAAVPAAARCSRPRAARVLIRPARLLGAARKAVAVRAQAADAPPKPAAADKPK